MAAQLDIAFTEPTSSAERRRLRFTEFIRANPQVYEEFVRRGRALKAAGLTHFGARSVWEAMREDYALRTAREPDQPKLNDHFLTPLVLLVDEREADLRGFFRCKSRKERAQ